MKSFKHQLGVLLVASFTASPIVFGQSNEEVFQDELSQCNYFANAPATFATYCFADDCHSAASGHTKMNGGSEVTPDNLVTIGSNSKFITAILALILIDKGYLGLDDKLASYFPEYARWEGVTVRNLLQHSSGVPDYLFSESGTRRTVLSFFNWRTRIWKPYELVNLVANEPSLFKAGSQVAYNNTNYILLGMVLEKAAKRPLEVLLDREIFAPLGIQNTYLNIMNSEKYRLVSGYYPLDLAVPDWFINFFSRKIEKTGNYLDTTNGFDSSYLWAAGGMASTTADLAKIVRALFTGQLISQKLLDEMKKFRDGAVLGFPLRYGLGLMTMPSAYGELLGHGGMTPGYYSVSNYQPQRDTVLTMAQNMAPGPTYSVYYDLLDLVNRDFPGKSFTADAAVSPDALRPQAIHVRTRGKLLPETAQTGIFSTAYGYSLVKQKPINDETFRNFQTAYVQNQGHSYLSISAGPGSNPYFSQSGQGKGTPFLKVTIDREKLLAQGAGLYKEGDGRDMIFAYRGLATAGENGKTSYCISEVLDTERPLAFQIDGQKDETFEPGQTLKFVGNLPMKKLSGGPIPAAVPAEFRKVCR